MRNIDNAQHLVNLAQEGLDEIEAQLAKPVSELFKSKFEILNSLSGTNQTFEQDRSEAKDHQAIKIVYVIQDIASKGYNLNDVRRYMSSRVFKQALDLDQWVSDDKIPLCEFLSLLGKAGVGYGKK